MSHYGRIVKKRIIAQFLVLALFVPISSAASNDAKCYIQRDLVDSTGRNCLNVLSQQILLSAIYCRLQLSEKRIIGHWRNKFMENNDKKKTGLSIIAIISLLFLIIVLAIIIFGQCRAKVQSVDELLSQAEQAFLCEKYLETLKIYQDNSLKYNAVALNNLGYMLTTGTGAARDVKSGLDYYNQAAKLGNAIALNNYILTILQYPTTYEEILDALKRGHSEQSPVVDDFIKKTSMSPNIVDVYGNLEPSEFWTLSYLNQIAWLKQITIEADVVPIGPDGEISEIRQADFVGEMCSKMENERVGYRTVTTSDGRTVIEEVYGLVTLLGYRTYCLQYVDFLENQQTFLYLEHIFDS